MSSCRVISLVLVMLGSTVGVASANSTVTVQDREQAACYNDVQKFCGEFVPDMDKTEACMLKVKDKVSAGCAKFYPEAKPAG